MRDVVSEIVAKGKRLHPRSGRDRQLLRRLEDLMSISKLLSSKKRLYQGARRELIRALPIGAIACLEGYTRLAIRDLVKSGQPYLDNAKNLKDVPLNFATLVDMERHKLSTADLVAHVVPLGSFDKLKGVLSAIIGQDFLEVMKPVIKDFGLSKGISFDKLAGTLIPGVEACFYQRNIFCHELAPKFTMDFKEINKNFGLTIVFIWYMEECVAGLLKKGS